MSFVLGIFLGGLSGYFGGVSDNIIQRSIEFIRSIPSIPLWMGLSASLPDDWDALKRYFAITVILSIVGWTGLAACRTRQVPVTTRRGFHYIRSTGWSPRNGIDFRYMLPPLQAISLPASP